MVLSKFSKFIKDLLERERKMKRRPMDVDKTKIKKKTFYDYKEAQKISLEKVA
jgi:hypothetical protein